MSFLRKMFGKKPTQVPVTEASSEQLIAVVLSRASYEPVHKQALEIISQRSNRDEMIPLVMEHFHKGENLYAVTSIIKAIGTPATFDPLLEIFRNSEPSELIDDGIFVKFADKPKKDDEIGVDTKGADRQPAVALVKLDPSLEKIKSKCSPEEFERILFLASSDVDDENPLVYQALVDQTTPRIIGHLMCRLEVCFRNSGYMQKKYYELIKQSLISSGESALPRIHQAIEKSSSRCYYNGYPEELLGILAAITAQSSKNQSKQASQTAHTPPIFEVSEVRELPIEKLIVFTEGTTAERNQSYDYAKHYLERLLGNLPGIVDRGKVDRDKVLLFFKKLDIEDPREYTISNLFDTTMSLIMYGNGKTTLKAWALTEQTLGDSSRVLVITIDNPIMPATLVCCKIGPGTYPAYYADGNISQRFGL
jgi:hypothetical protein